jgi:hypothetical protein
MAHGRFQKSDTQNWTLLSPVGDPQVEQFRIAGRVPDLNGKVIGLFWNGKPNGDIFLKSIAEKLQKRWRTLKIVPMWEVKPDTRTALGNSMDNLRAMALTADLIIGGSGD